MATSTIESVFNEDEDSRFIGEFPFVVQSKVSSHFTVQDRLGNIFHKKYIAKAAVLREEELREAIIYLSLLQLMCIVYIISLRAASSVPAQ